MKEKKKKYNIPIFIPHEGCGHECVFCNQRKITGVQTSVTPKEAREEIGKILSTIQNPQGEIEIAFFGGSFTGLDSELREEFFEVARSFRDERITGIRLSTRPDYINPEVMAQCKKFGVTTIELGVQSSDDRVLKLNRRGHTFARVVEASKMIKDAQIDLGLQMMVGMYGSSREADIKTCESIISLGPVCTRIYPTLVLEGTRLETLFEEGKYVPLTLEEAVDISAEILDRFQKVHINVIRIGLYPSEDLREEGNIVAGPFHSAFGELAVSRLYRNKIEKDIAEKNLRNCEYTVYAPPSETSKIIGQKASNRNYFKEKYGVTLNIANKA